MNDRTRPVCAQTQTQETEKPGFTLASVLTGDPRGKVRASTSGATEPCSSASACAETPFDSDTVKGAAAQSGALSDASCAPGVPTLGREIDARLLGLWREARPYFVRTVFAALALALPAITLIGERQTLRAERDRMRAGWVEALQTARLADHQLARAQRLADACVDLYLARDLACACFEPLTP